MCWLIDCQNWKAKLEFRFYTFDSTLSIFQKVKNKLIIIIKNDLQIKFESINDKRF